ncbi:MAG: hypothetical protein WCQ57_15235 [Verrucomicrobiota bacterium]
MSSYPVTSQGATAPVARAAAHIFDYQARLRSLELATSVFQELHTPPQPRSNSHRLSTILRRHLLLCLAPALFRA